MIKSIVKGVSDRVLRALPLRAAINLQFALYRRRLPRLNPPQTSNEKIANRKLFDRDWRMPSLADKILAKRHVAQVWGRIG